MCTARGDLPGRRHQKRDSCVTRWQRGLLGGSHWESMTGVEACLVPSPGSCPLLPGRDWAQKPLSTWGSHAPRLLTQVPRYMPHGGNGARDQRSV